MMKIEAEFDLGQIVYLKTDGEKNKWLVIAYVCDLNDGVKYKIRNHEFSEDMEVFYEELTMDMV